SCVWVGRPRPPLLRVEVDLGAAVAVLLRAWRHSTKSKVKSGGRGRPPHTYRLARSRLMMSSEVMTPVNFLLSSTTARVSRLYLSKSSATSFSLAPARVEI